MTFHESCGRVTIKLHDFLMTNKCNIPWPLTTKFCNKVIVFFSPSGPPVIPICHHVAKNFRSGEFVTININCQYSDILALHVGNQVSNIFPGIKWNFWHSLTFLIPWFFMTFLDFPVQWEPWLCTIGFTECNAGSGQPWSSCVVLSFTTQISLVGWLWLFSTYIGLIIK